MWKSGMRRVLDLGAGSGRHTLYLAAMGFQVVALDVSDTALRLLKAEADKRGIGNVTLVWHEMQHLPFPDGYFDGCVCTNVMHHGSSREVGRSFKEALRVIRDEGAALFVVVSDKDFRFGSGRKLEPKTFVFTGGEEKGIVHHFFDEKELRTALAGFRVVKLWEEFLPERKGNRAHLYAVVRKK
jgi:ubiquinone/menaquinone biosynthesis C-methylase UbiE